LLNDRTTGVVDARDADTLVGSLSAINDVYGDLYLLQLALNDSVAFLFSESGAVESLIPLANVADSSNSSVPVYVRTSFSGGTVIGGTANDLLLGSNASDSLSGGSGNDTIMGFHGADSIYSGANDDLVFAGNGPDFINLGAGSDTVYLGSLVSLLSSDTVGDGSPDLVLFSLADTAVSGSSVDAVVNFEVRLGGEGGDSIGGFAGYNVVDSQSTNAGWIEGGFLLNGFGADTVFDNLQQAISVIESLGADSTKYDLDANEVFLFRVSLDSYIGTTDGTKVTSVVKLVGVGAGRASFDLLESSTDGIFYIGPQGG